MTSWQGLTSKEAEKRLHEYGPNSLPEEHISLFLLFLAKFWTPVPWVLEIIIVLELFLGRLLEAWIIIALLIFNALLSFLQEEKAKNAVRLLRNKLDIQARVFRDHEWRLLSAQKLVPGDIIRLRMGDIIPADLQLLEGHISIDQSAITGESFPVEPHEGESIYAGSIAKHGEAICKVRLTGKKTFFGKTAEIMRTTKTPSHLEKLIFSIVKYLITFDILIIFFIMAYSLYQHIPLLEIVPFSLLLFVTSVPVALPATYALATALGAIELAKAGVLVTRLSAIEEAAAMNILCVDKTGTITKNILHVSSLYAHPPYTNDDLLVLAASACEESSQDPLDLAILKASQGCISQFSSRQRVQFIPFDPEKQYSKAHIHDDHEELYIFKGSPSELMKKVDPKLDLSSKLLQLSSDGSRILAVIAGKDSLFQCVGLIAFHDPPRETSKQAISEIQHLGVRVMMITGDGPTTAKFIAEQVGIGSKVISKTNISHLSEETVVKSDVISGIFPEDKFHIIQILQNQGNICGMTGDGVNDAPALKKAEVGIGVSNATDVAKAASSLILTNPGLIDVIEAIKSSRRIYQRMLTYVLNKIIKTLVVSVLLSLGLLITHQFIISQLLIVLLIFTNDFVTMSISTDRVSFSQKPDKWDIKKLIFMGSFFTLFILILSVPVLLFGLHILQLSLPEIRTWIFITLVFTAQATIYLIREQKHFWHSKPSYWMIICSLFDIIIVSIFAIKGYLMAPLKPSLVVGLLVLTLVYFILLDFIKVKFFIHDILK